MELPRRTLLQFAGAAVAAPAFSKLAAAQSYPTRPITMIVPFPAGGPTDAVGRILAERMRQTLRKPIIIENVGGADGTIGLGRAVRARPDGYTISFGPQTAFVLNSAFYTLPYDTLNDFAPVSLVTTNPLFLFANKTIPATDLMELIAWLKANPNKATLGSGALNLRMISALFGKEIGTQFDVVPYRGLAPVMQDLIAWQINIAFGTPDGLEFLRSGIIKAYAVTSTRRWAVAPDIPSFAELGLPSLSYSSWYGLYAPKGAPKDIIAKLNTAVVEALADAAVDSRLGELGFEMVPRAQQTPEALAAMQKADAAKWWPVIEELGIKAQ
jgi:tripartite-type tricarboxylate transporter receptor subunit TctC